MALWIHISSSCYNRAMTTSYNIPQLVEADGADKRVCQKVNTAFRAVLDIFTRHYSPQQISALENRITSLESRVAELEKKL